MAAEAGVTVAFEALAWGRHVNRVGQAWEAVVRADHPAVTLAVDTFHLLARGDDGAALAERARATGSASSRWPTPRGWT